MRKEKEKTKSADLQKGRTREGADSVSQQWKSFISTCGMSSSATMLSRYTLPRNTAPFRSSKVAPRQLDER